MTKYETFYVLSSLNHSPETVAANIIVRPNSRVPPAGMAARIPNIKPYMK